MKNRIILYCKLTVSLPDYSYILVRLNTLASTTPTYKNKMYLKDDKLTDRGCCWYSKDHNGLTLVNVWEDRLTLTNWQKIMSLF